ncbi:MAG: T9SS type A sorting domain-containing protein [Ignavibacteria bacterium]
MKKILLLSLIIISFNAIIIKETNAGDRNILVERFTSSTCPPCATYNPNLDAFLSSSDPNKVTSISYHMNWPAPGNDPMFLSNQIDNTARRTNYGVNSIPYWFFDGSYIGGVSSGQIQSAYNNRESVLSPLTIVVRETRSGSIVTVKAEIYCEFAVSNPSAFVHFAVIERPVQYPFPPGTNGESLFHDVMRKMLPSATGTPVTLLPGKKITLEYNYTIDPTWQADRIYTNVFVQGFANEIYNTAGPTRDFNLTSAPSYKVVNPGQAQSADYKVFIPVVASGYNSPVSFTAALETPQAGINLVFPGGTSINNFPDSLSLNVSSNASVPAGAYKIIVTGTSVSGRVHKTIVNYLVGKNYGIFAASRPQASYKVDNISYSTAKLFVWDFGTSHTLEAVSPVTIGSTRYVFDNWSNGGPILQNITVGTAEINYLATYKIQYKLISSVVPVDLPVTVNGGNTFYDSSATATITANPFQVSHNGKTYYFKSWEGSGIGSYTGTNVSPSIAINNVLLEKAIYDTIDVGISNYNSLIPEKFALYQNFPNPFNPTTNIRFDIAKSTFTSIAVYDALGKEVDRLVNQNLTPGGYEYSFNASNYPSGIYYYQINTNAFTEIKKMILLK